MTARLQRGGAPDTIEDWPLDTLVAYLFEGRECSEVRSLLQQGRGDAHGTRVTWEPVELSEEEFTEIERQFPQSVATQELDERRVVSVALTLPAMDPTLSIPIRADHPLVRRAARRAAYLRFDYGPWADVYVATLTRAEASELLDDPARRVNDEGEAELARRIVGEVDAALQFVVRRADAPPPWHRRPPSS